MSLQSLAPDIVPAAPAPLPRPRPWPTLAIPPFARRPNTVRTEAPVILEAAGAPAAHPSVGADPGRVSPWGWDG